MSSKSLILSEYAWEYLLFVSQRVQERDGQKQSEAVPASVRAEPPRPPSAPRPIVLVRAALCFVFPAEGRSTGDAGGVALR